jgi:hypothetical protein
VARPLKVELSEFAVGALARGEPHESEQVRRSFARAIRFYLHEAAARRPGWSVPSALRGERPEVELELGLDEKLLGELEAEAGKQDVSLSRLVSQAAIYYAAERDAGRITQRVLDDIEQDD